MFQMKTKNIMKRLFSILILSKKYIYIYIYIDEKVSNEMLAMRVDCIFTRISF